MHKQILGFLLVFATSFAMAAESGAIQEEVKKNYWSPLRGGLDLSYTPIAYKNLQWTDGENSEAKGHGVRIAVEWIPLGDYPYGKPVIGSGVGFTWITKAQAGNGVADLYTLPLSPYIGYRMEYFENQFLIPYGKIGMTYAFTRQNTKFETGTRVTEKPYLGFDYALGGELCLNVIDRTSVRNLDSLVGINGVFLFAEYSKSKDLGAQWANLSHEEIQMGMRFEF